MKILHIVTYISPDGAYGGPLRVAINQSRELQRLGHDVLIAGAAGGFQGPLPETYDGVPVRLFHGYTLMPGMGFAGIVAPGLMHWLSKTSTRADVIHIHTGRDLVSLPACIVTLFKRRSLVVQTHGMIDASSKMLSVPLDFFLTRPALSKSSAVLHLTENERKQVEQVAGSNLPYEFLPNGVELPEVLAQEQLHGPNKYPEVLYLARMHARKRPLMLVEAAERLKTRWPNAQFTLIGPDEGEAQKVQSAIEKASLSENIEWLGPIPTHATVERMRKASIFALPSLDEPFGMSVVEAMAVGLPVVVTDSCGLAPMIIKANAGIVCDPSLGGFANAVDTLLKSPELRIQMGRNGRKAVEQMYSLEKVTASLIQVYEKVTPALR